MMMIMMINERLRSIAMDIDKRYIRSDRNFRDRFLVLSLARGFVESLSK